MTLRAERGIVRKQFAQLVDEAAVAEFESLIEGQLPSDYREFLLKVNGGEPENARFTFLGKTGEYTDSVVRYFFSISNLESISLTHKYNIYVQARRVPAEMLPIACDFGGNLILLKVSGVGAIGSVYFWDHELEGIEESPNAPEHLELVGHTFEDFYSRLLPE